MDVISLLKELKMIVQLLWFPQMSLVQVLIKHILMQLLETGYRYIGTFQ